jgi:hypothetical protein
MSRGLCTDEKSRATSPKENDAAESSGKPTSQDHSGLTLSNDGRALK